MPGRSDNTPIEVPRGLANVVVTDTELSDVRGLEGFYHYRQYSAVELAAQRSFEDVTHLLLFGHLPDAAESAEFTQRLVAARALPDTVRSLLPGIAESSRQADSLAGLRIALSALGAAEGMRDLYDLGTEQKVADAIRLIAVTPVLLAALHRLRAGEEPLESRSDLGHVANYQYLASGEVPAAAEQSAISAYMVAAIDHGFNASTFATRVIASTGANFAACVVGGLGALSGPLHGGAPSRALDTLDAIGSPDRTEAWVRDAVTSGKRIMGFGHPVYRTEDPRSRMLHDIAVGFGGPRVEFATQVEETVLRLLAELKPGRELHTNLEFYAAIVMEHCGIPREMFTPTFAAARVAGWAANALEQSADSKIIRPAARYVGPPAPQPLPPL